MGIDLELADCAAAGYRLMDCRQADPVCPHDPDCAESYHRLLADAAAQDHPTEFPYRRFADINEYMRQTGMGYPAEPEPGFLADDDTDLGWRSQTSPGRTGIPSFKLMSNDRWLVTAQETDEALAAYAVAPADLKATLETEPKWVSWLEWLAVARHHGGFEAE